MRDLVQIVSFLVSIAILIIVGVKIHQKHGSPIAWFPLILIGAANALFYVAVYIDAYVVDFMNASDVSAWARLSTLIALLLYAVYMPPTVRKGKP